MAGKAKMLMPRCPSCHSRLPFSEVFAASSVACPGCHRELKPQRWVVVVTTLLVIGIVQGVSYLAERSGFNLAVRLTVSTACGLAGGALGHVLLVRYRPKDPPLSILPTPDALRGDDVPHRK
jgi:predicted Na+-dependent transporter